MRITRFIVFITLLIIFTSSVKPSQARTSNTPAANNVGDLDDPAEVEAFVDLLVTRQLEERKIPGATVAIVKDRELLFAKGYGFADVEAQKPVIADSDPHEVQMRITWYENPILMMNVGGLALLTLCSSLVAYPLMSRRRKFVSEPRLGRLARSLIMTIAGLYLIFLLWLTVGAGLMVMNNFIEMMGGMSKLLPIPLIFPAVAAILTIGVTACDFLAWKDGYWSTGDRIYYTVLTLAAIVFVWWLNYWNLLGWHL